MGFRAFGRVQGVGFRWWTKRTAEGLGLIGSVRNLPDGSVEVRAAGGRTAVEKLELRLQRGPIGAAVHRVEPFEIESLSGNDFRIEP